MSAQMTTMKTKQNELDAKITSILDSQHGHSQTINDIKLIFSKFLSRQKETCNLVHT
jgi:cephalosporin hydroxylase